MFQLSQTAELQAIRDRMGMESLRLFLSLNETIHESRSVSAIARNSLEHLATYFGHDFVSLQVTGDTPDQPKIFTSGTALRPSRRSRSGSEFPSWVVLETNPLHGSGKTPVFGGKDLSRSPWLKNEWVQSEMNFPLGNDSPALGLLSISRFHGSFSEDELEVAAKAAEIIARNLGIVERLSTLKEYAFQDGLTGVLNRRSFEDYLSREFKRSARYRSPLSLIILDVDHFKRLNDSRGHRVGDEALRFLAKTVRSAVREIDLLFRYGGEEFAILLPETGGDFAVTTAERLRQKVQSDPFAGSWGQETLTVSAGICWTPRPDVHSPEDLVKKADQALYRAKNEGRNRVFSSDPAGEAT